MQKIRNIESAHDRVLQQTIVVTPSGQSVMVSTVEVLGLYRGDFETMVFPVDEQDKVTNWTEMEFERYFTAAQAMAGHAEMVQKWYEKPNQALTSGS